MAVNVTGPFLFCRQALPVMIEQGGGVIINTASVSGLLAHESFGHGVEMDQFVKDRAKAERVVGKTAELRFRPVLLNLPPAAKKSTTTTTTTPSGTTTPGETTVAPTTTTTARAMPLTRARASLVRCLTHLVVV
jgi:NAD(P)-dependent dehydrogenase (short-subunit alcohol dehydrogenase family)